MTIKPVAKASAHKAEAVKENQKAAARGADQKAGNEDVNTMEDVAAGAPAPEVDAEKVDDGTLPQTHPEPADVAGASGPGGGGADTETRYLAHLARDAADARLRAGEMPNAPVDNVINGSNIDAIDPSLTGATAYTEATLPDRRAQEIKAWAAAHPEATVIPPSLLPDNYRDPMIATPGIGDDLIAMVENAPDPGDEHDVTNVAGGPANEANRSNRGGKAEHENDV